MRIVKSTAITVTAQGSVLGLKRPLGASIEVRLYSSRRASSQLVRLEMCECM